MTIETPSSQTTAVPVGSEAGLLAIYDLSVSPLTFDIMPFLVAAEIAREEVGASHIHFVLVPSEQEGHYGNLGEVSKANLEWRQRQIVIAATALMHSVQAISVLPSRAAAQEFLESSRGSRFPEYYSTKRPAAGFSVAEVEASAFAGKSIPSLAASSQSRAFVARWLNAYAGGRKPISLTLRDSDNATGKNSKLDAWSDFLKSLDDREYFPILIRDTDRVFVPSPQQVDWIQQFPLAAVNIELRAAIYEACYLNLVGSSGPTMLCMFDASIRCLNFNFGAPGWHDTTHEAIRRNFGLRYGMQLRHASPYQRVVWGSDEADVIGFHFDLMIRFIEGGEAALRNDDERRFFHCEHGLPEDIADLLFTERQWGPAKTLYRHLLNGKPDSPEWIYRLGVAESWAGNPKRGLELFQKAEDSGLSGAALFLARCEALIFQGKTDQAVANARHALELDPNNFDAAFRLGILYDASNLFDDAVYWLDRALSIRPDSSDAIKYLESVRSRVRAT